MIRGISKSELAQLANFIEEETFLDEEVALEIYRNCLLLHFPLMCAVKLGADVFINIHDLIMQTEAFLTIQKEKSAQQKKVTQARKKKKKPIFCPVFPSLVPILTNFIK